MFLCQVSALVQIIQYYYYVVFFILVKVVCYANFYLFLFLCPMIFLDMLLCIHGGWKQKRPIKKCMDEKETEK